MQVYCQNTTKSGSVLIPKSMINLTKSQEVEFDSEGTYLFYFELIQQHPVWQKYMQNKYLLLGNGKGISLFPYKIVITINSMANIIILTS